MSPKITIGIPTYNGGDWIEQCLDSIFNQTYQDFVILISDDGSSDNTLDIIKKYADNDPRITIQYNNHKKVNVLSIIDSCNTPYLKFVCQDDWLLPDCLKVQIEHLESDPKIGLVTSPTFLCFDKKLSKLKIDRISYGKHSPNKKLFRQLMLEGNIIGPPAAVTFRTDILKDFNQNDYIEYLSELMFYLDALKKNHDFFVTDTPQDVYRIQKNMKTFANKESVIDKYKILIAEYSSLTGLKPGFKTNVLLHYWHFRRVLNKLICKFLLMI